MSDKPKFYDFVNVYEFTCELPGSKENIQFKPVSTGQLKKLLTYENETNYVIQERALDELITSNILTEEFNVDELYIYDRLFLLIELRKKTKGEVIEFQVTCPKCHSQSLNRVNLDELETKQIDENMNTIVDLDQVKVHLRHMKRKHQKKDITPNYFSKSMSESQTGYMFQVLFHACAIDKIETPSGIDEDIPMEDRVYFIENIPMEHMEIIKDKVNDMSFGWKLQNKVKCVHPDCGFEHTEEIPIQQNFFG